MLSAIAAKLLLLGTHHVLLLSSPGYVKASLLYLRGILLSCLKPMPAVTSVVNKARQGSLSSLRLRAGKLVPFGICPQGSLSAERTRARLENIVFSLFR